MKTYTIVLEDIKKVVQTIEADNEIEAIEKAARNMDVIEVGFERHVSASYLKEEVLQTE